MKTSPPPANIIIGIIYLLFIVATFYVCKLVLKITYNLQSKQNNKKINIGNYHKVLTSKQITSELNIRIILAKSYVFKYTLIGAVLNSQKFYLQKQLLILSIILVSCISINRITIWPISLAIAFSLIFFIFSEFFQLPKSFKYTMKINQKKKINRVQDEPQNFVQHEQRVQNIQQKQNKQEQSILLSKKYQLICGILALTSVLMVSNSMLTVFHSVSNLGALSISSFLIILTIDQFGFRVFLGGCLLLVSQIIIKYYQRASQEQQQVKVKSILDFRLMRNLCEENLVQRINQIYLEKGEPQDFLMGASPLKSKTKSPSKVPKAKTLYFETDTLVNLQGTVEQDQNIEKIEQQMLQNQQTKRSPIKQIFLSNQKDENSSVIFTSLQQNLFGEQHNNQENKSNQLNYVGNIDFFSAQRSIKMETLQSQEEQFGEDELVINDCPFKNKMNMIQADFSPNKRKKNPHNFGKKKRQIILTGNSPYLQYLPNMMKNKNLAGVNRKSTAPVHSSAYIDPCISRKIL